MKNLIKRWMNSLFYRLYNISCREDWNYFKKNTIDFIYRYAIKVDWSARLTNEWIIKFFSRFSFGSRLTSIYYTLRFFVTRKPVAPMIEYVVTTHCTMKCKHCNTKIPYFSKDTHYPIVDYNTFKNDLDRLLNGVDYILLFGFVGGEPLLVKDLYKMIDYALAQEKVHSVFVASNCTILPSKELLNVMRNKKFSIQISDYSDVANLPPGIRCHHDDFKRLLIDNSINFNDPHQKSSRMNWFTMPEVYADYQDDDLVRANFNKCFGRDCNMCCDGKITQCTLTVYISRCMRLSEDIMKEIVDIRISTDIRRDLIKFYCRPYSAFCHYCHFEHMEYGLPCGEQVETQPEENRATNERLP